MEQDNIIELIDCGIIQEKNYYNVYMVFEFGEIDLHKLLLKQAGKPIKDNFIRLYPPILLSIHALHSSRHCIHRTLSLFCSVLFFHSSLSEKRRTGVFPMHSDDSCESLVRAVFSVCVLDLRTCFPDVYTCGVGCAAACLLVCVFACLLGWLVAHRYWQQMLEAVHTIHEERIVHSDLKPANFLIVEGMVKLIDFGIAKAIESNDTTNIVRDNQVQTLSPKTTPTITSGFSLNVLCGA